MSGSVDQAVDQTADQTVEDRAVGDRPVAARGPEVPRVGRSTAWAAHRARVVAEGRAAAHRQHLARRSATTSALLVVALVVVGLTGWGAARLPGSPVRDWVERRPADVTAVSFADPGDLPSTFVPGDAVDVAVEVHRTTAPGAPQEAEQLRWTALWEPSGGSAVPLQEGSTDVPPGGTRTLAVTAVPPGTASGRLLVSFDSGQWLALRLEALGG